MITWVAGMSKPTACAAAAWSITADTTAPRAWSTPRITATEAATSSVLRRDTTPDTGSPRTTTRHYADPADASVFIAGRHHVVVCTNLRRSAAPFVVVQLVCRWRYRIGVPSTTGPVSRVFAVSLIVRGLAGAARHRRAFVQPAPVGEREGDGVMSDGASGEGRRDIPSALEREVDHLARRFPGVPRAEISRQMSETYVAFDSTATIKAHLVSLTAARVASALRELAARALCRPTQTRRLPSDVCTESWRRRRSAKRRLDGADCPLTSPRRLLTRRRRTSAVSRSRRPRHRCHRPPAHRRHRSADR